MLIPHRFNSCIEQQLTHKKCSRECSLSLIFSRSEASHQGLLTFPPAVIKTCKRDTMEETPKQQQLRPILPPKRNESNTTSKVKTAALPKEALISCQDWTRCSSSEIDLLVPCHQGRKEEEIEAVAPSCLPGLLESGRRQWRRQWRRQQ